MFRMDFKYVLLMCGLHCLIQINAKVLQNKLSGNHRTDLLNTYTLEKENRLGSEQGGYETFYNPVLQNVSVLHDYLKTERSEKRSFQKRNVRKKRSRNRNCSGLCERSLCSWREEWDEEITRVPQFIKYAVCDSPRCDFSFADLSNEASFALQINTYCDVIKVDMLVTENGGRKWLTDWPIACACTQRMVDVQFRHTGRNVQNSPGQIDIDITRNEAVTPVSRQRIVLNGVRQRTLTRSQRRRLRNQIRHMQNAESWEQIMARKRVMQNHGSR